MTPEELRVAADLLSAKKVVAGFDGFVDSIQRVVQEKADTATYFQTIAQFGKYISSKAGSGFSLETEERFQRAGGNMPILANAMALLGAQVDCIGAMGLPVLHPAFGDLHERCRLFSFANPGLTTALEFNDGKLFLGQMKPLQQAGWAVIKTLIGLERITESYHSCDLACLVNWGEIDPSTGIWMGLLEEVIGGLPKKERYFFFDLSDCSKRNAGSIREAVQLMERFGAAGHVTLSLNRNEARLLFRILTGGENEDAGELAQALSTAVKIDRIVIHTAQVSVAVERGQVISEKPVFIPAPLIATGAGDNFNAGFCCGILMGCTARDSLQLGNAVAGMYMRSGKSPDPLTLIKNWPY